MNELRKSIVRRWLPLCLVVVSPVVAAVRRPLVLAALHVATVCAVGQAITINFTYSNVAPHPEDQDGSKLRAITQAAAQYYEALLPQVGPFRDTTFTFDLRWEDLGNPGPPGQYRRPLLSKHRLAVNMNYDWYFDPDPLDHSEFDIEQVLYRDLSPFQQGAFTGNPPDLLEVGFRGLAKRNGPANDKYDLFTVVLHEIGHALGVRKPNFGSRSQYPFPSELIGGLDAAAKAKEGDSGHLAATDTLMAVTGNEVRASMRFLPSATDLLAMANRIDNVAATLAPFPGQYNRVLPDLDRVDFIGTQSGNHWEDPLNWIGGRVPNGEKEVFIRHGGSVFRLGSGNLNINDTSRSPGKLVVSDRSFLSNAGEVSVGEAGTGAMTISSGGNVFSDSGSIGFHTGSKGTVTVAGTGSAWTNSGTLVVSRAGRGTLRIEGGGRVFNTNGVIGTFDGATGEAIVIGGGSSWTNHGSLTVGMAGTGSLIVGGRGRVSSSSADIGLLAPSNSTVTVIGDGSTWTNSGDLRVGVLGTGTLNIERGGLVDVGGKLSINASSTVNLDGGTLRFDDYKRAGTFSYRAGTIQLAGTRVVGTDAAINDLFRTPTLFDDDRFLFADDTIGFEADWSTSGDSLTFHSLTAIAASAGSDTLMTQDTVASGSSLFRFPTWLTVPSGKALVIEGATDIETDLRVSGGSFTSQSLASVGASGTGRLTVQNGGSVTTDSAIIGNALGSEGTVTVSGAGSTWTNSGSLDVGRNGSGTLTIEGGGVVSSASASVGRRSGSTGVVRVNGDSSGSTGVVPVTGTNSNWTVAGSLSIGGHTSIRGSTDGGAGEVTVGPGGSVNVAHDTVLLPDGLLKLDGGRLVTDSIRFEAPRRFDRFTQWSSGEGQFDWTSGTLHVGTFDGDLMNSGGTLALGRPVASTLNPGGTLEPDTSAGSMLITGNYEQLSGGALAIEIGGTLPGDQLELISIGGTATLDGMLDVSLVDGFIPQLDQQFEVLSAGSVINNGLMLGGPAADLFDLLVDTSRVVLQAIGTAAPGDLNGDGLVDAADYTLWRDGLGGALDAERYSQWKTNFDAAERGVASVAMSGGPIAVPEPASPWLMLGVMACWGRRFPRNTRPAGVIS